MESPVRVLSVLLALSLFVLVPAQAAAPVTPPLYEIEILVFENRLPELEGGELWRGEPRITPELFREAVAMDGSAAPPPDSALRRAAALLEKDGHYRILTHQRWQQTAEARSAAKPVKLASYDPAFNGVVRFYLSRFLHVDLELVLRARADSGEPAEQAYWINEHQRIRTKALHYFDHPKLGALLRVEQIGKD